LKKANIKLSINQADDEIFFEFLKVECAKGVTHVLALHRLDPLICRTNKRR